MNASWFRIALLTLASTSLFAQQVPPKFVSRAIGETPYRTPPVIAAAENAAPLVTLEAATLSVPEQIEAMAMWNRTHPGRPKNGFTRSLIDVLAARLPVGVASISEQVQSTGIVRATSDGNVVWSGSVKVRGAWGLRLHLTSVNVPTGTTFWVKGTAGNPVMFDRRLVGPDGDLYAPAVGGEVASLEVEIPASAPAGMYGFHLTDVVELVGREPAATASSVRGETDSSACIIDVNCASTNYDSMEASISADAYLEFVDAGESYACSGTLINDKDPNSFQPYLLTAHHCIGDAATAASVEAYWDFASRSCGGSWPSIWSLPRSIGSQVLATSSVSDFTLLKLASVPGGHWYLGWTARTLTNGTLIYRVSHPSLDVYPWMNGPGPQMFSYSVFSSTASACSGYARPNFLYSTYGGGGIYDGSSGSAAVVDGGYIVGQLSGLCGPTPSDGCYTANKNTDGAFATTYSYISQYIDTEQQSCTCSADTNTACLLDGRFKVKVTFTDNLASPPRQANALVVRYAENQPQTHATYGTLGELTFFAFYDFAAKKVEIVAKIYKGVGINDRYWVYVAGMTDADFTITITDTRTCQTWQRHNPQGSYMNVADLYAFPFP